jgi:magnesium-transporting ATPase (P-type)
VSELRVR